MTVFTVFTATPCVLPCPPGARCRSAASQLCLLRRIEQFKADCVHCVLCVLCSVCSLLRRVRYLSWCSLQRIRGYSLWSLTRWTRLDHSAMTEFPVNRRVRCYSLWSLHPVGWLKDDSGMFAEPVPLLFVLVVGDAAFHCRCCSSKILINRLDKGLLSPCAAAVCVPSFDRCLEQPTRSCCSTPNPHPHANPMFYLKRCLRSSNPGFTFLGS
jgi:hypothetical protein